MQAHSSTITVTDQFCGAGGSTTGAKQVTGVEVILAMNHWELAIQTHNTNHPTTDHVLADISKVDPRRYPPTDILITSPECTNHSLAKGKARRNLAQLPLWKDGRIDPSEERSRATAWDVPRFAEVHNYRIIIVENVVDFRHWRLFDAWIHAMSLLDYDFEIIYYNSMFAHPTPQSRDRMYIVFWKRGNKKPDFQIRPPAYCAQCDAKINAVQSWKNDRRWGRYGKQYVYLCPRCAHEVNPFYYPAYTAIDWSLPVERIGDRKNPLKPRTLARIAYGLAKYGGQSVAVELGYSHAGEKRSSPVEFPLPTQTTRQTLGLAVPPFLMAYYTRKDTSSLTDEPVPTVTAENRFGLVIPPFLAVNYGGNHARSVDEPFGTVTCVDHHAPITPPFISSYYGNNQASSIDRPMPTISTIDHHALIEPGEGEALKVEDCGFRMIQPHEIQAAMAFPGDYQVLGTKRDKVRQLGNAVTPPVMQMLIERCVETFI